MKRPKSGHVWWWYMKVEGWASLSTFLFPACKNTSCNCDICSLLLKRFWRKHDKNFGKFQTMNELRTKQRKVKQSVGISNQGNWMFQVKRIPPRVKCLIVVSQLCVLRGKFQCKNDYSSKQILGLGLYFRFKICPRHKAFLVSVLLNSQILICWFIAQVRPHHQKLQYSSSFIARNLLL